MKKVVFTSLLTLGLLTSESARCDLFGGDVAVLAQILVQTIEQLNQLRQVLSTGRDAVNIARDINRGINDSLQMLRTIFPKIDPGIYKNWGDVASAIHELEKIYGPIVSSPESKIQKDADTSVAEAITLNNDIYKYTKDIDQIGESIKDYSHQVSPGGAAKLSAEAQGIMLTVMNQELRAQATSLKIQAQSLAIENHKEKAMTNHLLESAKTMGRALNKVDISYKLPEFE